MLVAILTSILEHRLPYGNSIRIKTKQFSGIDNWKMSLNPTILYLKLIKVLYYNTFYLPSLSFLCTTRMGVRTNGQN